MTRHSYRNERAGRESWEKQMQHRRIPLHFFAGSQSRRWNTTCLFSHSHSRNLCTSPAQLCFPWADLGSFPGTAKLQGTTAGLPLVENINILQEKWSQQRFSWLLQQTCYYLCFLTWCKCPTPSLWQPWGDSGSHTLPSPAPQIILSQLMAFPSITSHTGDNPASWKGYTFHLWDYLFLICPM